MVERIYSVSHSLNILKLKSFLEQNYKANFRLRSRLWHEDIGGHE